MIREKILSGLGKLMGLDFIFSIAGKNGVYVSIHGSAKELLLLTTATILGAKQQLDADAWQILSEGLRRMADGEEWEEEE